MTATLKHPYRDVGSCRQFKEDVVNYGYIEDIKVVWVQGSPYTIVWHKIKTGKRKACFRQYRGAWIENERGLLEEMPQG